MQPGLSPGLHPILRVGEVSKGGAVSHGVNLSSLVSIDPFALVPIFKERKTFSILGG